MCKLINWIKSVVVVVAGVVDSGCDGDGENSGDCDVNSENSGDGDGDSNAAIIVPML